MIAQTPRAPFNKPIIGCNMCPYCHLASGGLLSPPTWACAITKRWIGAEKGGGPPDYVPEICELEEWKEK